MHINPLYLYGHFKTNLKIGRFKCKNPFQFHVQLAVDHKTQNQYACMSVCLSVCLIVCMYASMCMHLWRYASMCMQLWRYASLCMHLGRYASLCMHLWMYVCMHVCVMYGLMRNIFNALNGLKFGETSLNLNFESSITMSWGSITHTHMRIYISIHSRISWIELRWKPSWCMGIIHEDMK